MGFGYYSGYADATAQRTVAVDTWLKKLNVGIIVFDRVEYNESLFHRPRQSLDYGRNCE